jgi:hypothetical protein
LLLFGWKNVSGAYIVSAHFGKQHINLVNPIIDFTSFYITSGLTNARKRRFDLHLMNTEDQLFPQIGLIKSQYFLNPGCWPVMQHPKSND